MTRQRQTNRLAILKTLAVILLTAPLLFASTWLQAETRYISDDLRVPLRKTPCNRCAILHHGLKSGTSLKVVEDNNDGWTHVTTSGGLDGWLPTQYLVTQQIARHRIIKVEKQLAATKADNIALQQQLQDLTEANQSLTSQLTSVQTESGSISAALNNIRKISASAISIQQQNEELLTKNRMLQGEIDILSATNEQLRSNEHQSWFLYGGLSVFMGALLTILIPRLKRRKKFSEWG